MYVVIIRRKYSYEDFFRALGNEVVGLFRSKEDANEWIADFQCTHSSHHVGFDVTPLNSPYELLKGGI